MLKKSFFLITIILCFSSIKVIAESGTSEPHYTGYIHAIKNVTKRGIRKTTSIYYHVKDDSIQRTVRKKGGVYSVVFYPDRNRVELFAEAEGLKQYVVMNQKQYRYFLKNELKNSKATQYFGTSTYFSELKGKRKKVRKENLAGKMLGS